MADFYSKTDKIRRRLLDALGMSALAVVLWAGCAGGGDQPSEPSRAGRIAPLTPGARTDLEAQGVRCSPNPTGPTVCSWEDAGTVCTMTFDSGDALVSLICSVSGLTYSCARPMNLYVCRWSDHWDCADVHDESGTLEGHYCGRDLDERLGHRSDGGGPFHGDGDGGVADVESTSRVDANTDAHADGGSDAEVGVDVPCGDAQVGGADAGSRDVSSLDSGDMGEDRDGGLPVPSATGCADGQREGFLEMGRYPRIAACSGAWEVPGVTRPDLAPTCGRLSGDDSAHPTGNGCSAADLCADGWHICRGAREVEILAGSCADAVPPAAPSKSLFFAVNQPSLQASVCTVAGDNDVFGCGNLGTMLGLDKRCGPLDRVLASTSPGVCGHNEAEPPQAPWECRGGGDAHYHEGALVTKSACVNASCSYDGYPVGPQDKGGVLCCRD